MHKTPNTASKKKPKPVNDLGFVLGGGGWFGIGFNCGVLDGIKERGFEISDSKFLGTSAGSWAGAAQVLDVDFSQIVELSAARFPNPRSGVLARTAREVFGEKTHPNIEAVACGLPFFKREVLSGKDWCVADLVAASSAVPGLLAPHKIGGKYYVDGGVRSATSVDLGPECGTLVVVAPLGGEVFGWSGRRVGNTVQKEAHIWKEKFSKKVKILYPPEELSKQVVFVHRLFDKGLALKAYEYGLLVGKDLDL